VTVLRPAAFAPAADPARLLAAVADALNACERAGITVTIPGGAVATEHGYVLPVGDPRIGSRWAVRTRRWTGFSDREGDDDD
jgi:hypothetical protein